MKKTGILTLTILLIMVLPVMAFGMTGPAVSENHGEISGVFISNDGGIQIGGKYGINNDLGLLLEVGQNDYSKLAIMYQLNPNVTIDGGMLRSQPFIGVMGATALNKQLQGMGEIDLSYVNKEFVVNYQAGVEYAVKKDLDIRGGILGSTVGNSFAVGMGVGYHF